jgi:hypothetical protein
MQGEAICGQEVEVELQAEVEVEAELRLWLYRRTEWFTQKLRGGYGRTSSER